MVKGKLKLPEDPQYRKQVKTFIARHGRKAYAEIGSRGGKPTPASFDSERGRKAALIMWEKRRQAALAAERGQSEQQIN